MSDLGDTNTSTASGSTTTATTKWSNRAVRNTLAAAHHFLPSDHNAIFVANLMHQLHQFQIITIALQVCSRFVGALTLGIAGIGLMNIMLVAVQQRTREIGIEKALGARRRHILLQFLAEALVITASAASSASRSPTRSRSASAASPSTAPSPSMPRPPISAC